MSEGVSFGNAGGSSGSGGSVTQGTIPWVTQISNVNANGQALKSASSPVVLASDWYMQDQLHGWLLNGQMYSASTVQTAPASNNIVGMSLLNNNTAKNMLVISAKVAYATSVSQHKLNLYNADQALSGLSGIGPFALKAGGAASVATVEGQNTNIATLNGNTIFASATTGNTPIELLANIPGVLLPASAINSLTLFVNSTAASVWEVTFVWVEF